MLYESDQDNKYLQHYGVPGQKWGVRRFQNEDGTLTAAGKERYYKDTSKDSKKETMTSKQDKDISSEQNNTKRFLIGAGIIALAAVGTYAAFKIKNNQNSIYNAGLPKSWPDKKDFVDVQNKFGHTEQLLTEHFSNEIESNLSSIERKAISDYTYSDGASDINYYLERNSDGNSDYRIKTKSKHMREHFEREPGREKWCQDRIQAIDSALEKSKTPIELVVDRKTEFSNVRGMFGVSANELADIFRNPEKAVGRVINQKSYCSTSIDSMANGTFGQCNLHILVPKGSKGMYIASLSGSPREKEFLLPRNSNFKVTEVRNFSEDPDTIYFSSVEIFAELIGQKNY